MPNRGPLELGKGAGDLKHEVSHGRGRVDGSFNKSNLLKS
jgi:hypothetical protein